MVTTKTLLTLVPQADCAAARVSGFGRLMTEGGKPVIGATVDVVDNSGLVLASSKTDPTGVFVFVGGLLGSSMTFKGVFAGTAALATSETRRFNIGEFCGRFPVVVGRTIFAYQRTDQLESMKPIMQLVEQLKAHRVFLQGNFAMDAPHKLGVTYEGGGHTTLNWDIIGCIPGRNNDPEPTRFIGIRWVSAGLGPGLVFFDRAIDGHPITQPISVEFDSCEFVGPPTFVARAKGVGQQDQVILRNCKSTTRLLMDGVLFRAELCDFNNLEFRGSSLLAFITGSLYSGTIDIGADGSSPTVVATGSPGRTGSTVNKPNGFWFRDPASGPQNEPNGNNGNPGGGSF